MSALSEEVALGLDPGAFRVAAQSLLDQPGIIAVSWLDAQLEGARVTLGDEAATALLSANLIEGPSPTRQVIPPRSTWFRPLAHGDEKNSAALLLENEAATLTAIFAPNRAIAAQLDGETMGYQLRLQTGAQAEAGVSAPSQEPTHAVVFESPFDPESTWRLNVSSTSKLGWITLPTLVLLLGLAVSLFLALTIWFGQLANHWAQALLADNLELRLGGEELTSTNRMLEEAVRERTAELQTVVDELETFNYSVSHDLRSPLGAILNYSSLLEEDYGDVLEDEGRTFLDRMRKNAGQVVSMMDSLLVYSRVGRKELEPSEVEVEPLVRSAWAEVGTEESRARVRFQVLGTETVRADRSLLKTALVCLLENALKFSREAEEPAIEVRSETADGEVRITVEDNGIGFEPSDTEKLFRALERGRASKEYSGHGVGLAVVSRIALRHHGRVNAERLSGGSRFCLTLPSVR